MIFSDSKLFINNIMYTKIILLLILSLISNSRIFSQSAWVNQASGISSNLVSVFFINSNTGWASGTDGTVIKTTNGGTNWIIQNSTTTLPLINIMFGDENTGWAAGGFDDNNPLCYHRIMVIRTTNGGNLWTQQISGNGFLYNDLFVVSNQKAYITNSGICCPPFCIAESGGLGFTSNSGQNWYSSLDRPSHSVFFLNENSGWVSSRTSDDVLPVRNYIYRTTNAGTNWGIMYVDSTSYNPFRNLFFTDELTGYAQRGSLIKSTNAGINWTATDNLITSGTSDNFFVNKDTGWCTGGSGKIIRTDNGGMNWTFQTTNTANHLSSVYFADEFTGWAVGSNGTVIKTVTGGLTSVSQSTVFVNSFLLIQNYPNPFNPVTHLEFGISNLGFVTLKIYNALGQVVSTLVNESRPAGYYNVEFDGSDLPSGIYFYKLEAGDLTETKRMILLK